MQPLVSIIVPVYNVEKYISQCIESILSQTYTNIELLCIIDGSPDRSEEICLQYAKKDSRVKVLAKENGGVTSARKYGLEHIHGQWVMIVDGDDWIEAETVEACLCAAQAHHADCISAGYFREYNTASIPTLAFKEETVFQNISGTNEVTQRLLGPIGKQLRNPCNVDSLSTVWMKLYRTDLIQKGKFIDEREVGYSEDTVFNIYALSNSRCMIYINKCYYHYRKTNDSSVTTKYRDGLAEKKDLFYTILHEFIQEKHDRPSIYIEAFYNRICCGMIGLGMNEIANPKGRCAQAKSVKSILQKPLYREAFSRLKISDCSIQWKIFFLLCKFRSSFLLVFLLRFMRRLKQYSISQYLR